VKKHKTEAVARGDVRQGQLELGLELTKLIKRLSKIYPGVWRPTAFDDLLVIAEELPLMAQKEIDARVLLWWQPMLSLEYAVVPKDDKPDGWLDDEGQIHPFATDSGDGLHLCRVCLDRETTSPDWICEACKRQGFLDENVPH
jgi:hypothetical protein